MIFNNGTLIALLTHILFALTCFVCVADRRHKTTEGRFQRVAIEYWPIHAATTVKFCHQVSLDN